MLRSKLKTRCPQCNQTTVAKRSFSYENNLNQFKCYKCGYHQYMDLTWVVPNDTITEYDPPESGE